MVPNDTNFQITFSTFVVTSEMLLKKSDLLQMYNHLILECFCQICPPLWLVQKVWAWMAHLILDLNCVSITVVSKRHLNILCSEASEVRTGKKVGCSKVIFFLILLVRQKVFNQMCNSWLQMVEWNPNKLLNHVCIKIQGSF